MNSEEQTMNSEQQISRIFFKLEKILSQALGMHQQEYVHSIMLHTFVSECWNRFIEGHKEVKDGSWRGRSSTGRTKVNMPERQMLSSDCRLTVRMITSQWYMTKDRVSKIINGDLDMSKIGTQNVAQKEYHKQVCRDNFLASSNWTKLSSLRRYWCWDIDFSVRPGKQVPGQSLELSNVA